MIAFSHPTSVPLNSGRQRHSKRCLLSKRNTICATSLPSVLVVGGSGKLGIHVTNYLQSHTTDLHATYLTKSSDLKLDDNQVHELDACDSSAVETLISTLQPHTIINCVGGDVTEENQPDREATKNIMKAATDVGTKRFILISALGAGNSEESVPFQVMMTMRPMLLEKSHAEAFVKSQRYVPWTIIRPAPLIDPNEEGKGAVVTEGLQCYGTIDREEVAKVVAQAAVSEKAIGKTLHVVDRGRLLITSPYVRPMEFWEPLPFEEFEL